MCTAALTFWVDVISCVRDCVWLCPLKDALCAAGMPRWASANIGVLLCLACAAKHRGLGTDISQVRSTSLDTWTQAMADKLEATGNARSNAIYEATMRPSDKIGETASDADRERFIRRKYVEVRASQCPSAIGNSHATVCLCSAAGRPELPRPFAP